MDLNIIHVLIGYCTVYYLPGGINIIVVSAATISVIELNS